MVSAQPLLLWYAVYAMTTCQVCHKRLTAKQVATAESRGRVATYCSPRCRRTAARRRERSKAKDAPTAPAEKAAEPTTPAIDAMLDRLAKLADDVPPNRTTSEP